MNTIEKVMDCVFLDDRFEDMAIFRDFNLVISGVGHY